MARNQSDQGKKDRVKLLCRLFYRLKLDILAGIEATCTPVKMEKILFSKISLCLLILLC